MNRLKANILKLLFLILFFRINATYSQAGKLMAGTAKINITPATDEILHDSIYARSLVLDFNGRRLAFVSVDLAVFTSERVLEICRKRFDIRNHKNLEDHSQKKISISHFMKIKLFWQ